MRRSLFAAASIIALAASPAFAQDSGDDAEVRIDDTREEPVDTATAEGGSPANLIIGSSGRVQLRDAPGPAVRVNSDNDLLINSGAQVEILDTDADGEDLDLDGAVGVQVDPGVEADITHGGAIFLNDTYVPTATEGEVDSDGDGEPDADDPEADGPFARDANKTGLLIGEVDESFDPVAGQDGVTGSVELSSGSSVRVAGQDSFGVRTVADISGDLVASGGVSVRGERSRAISIEGDVGGDVSINAAEATSPGGEAVAVEGDVGGGLRLVGQISVSGYRIPQRIAQDFVDQLEDEDLQNSGSAVLIAGNVVDGVFVSNSATLSQFSGDGAAVEIGRGNETVTIGQVALPDDFLAASGEEDEDEDRDQLDHAVVNEGTIRSNGTYDNRDATAFLIGGRDDQGQLRAVVLGGDGFHNDGLIEATAYDATSIGLQFGEGSQGEALSNTGRIIGSAQIGYEDDPSNNQEAYASGRAIGLHLAQGSSLRRILNEEGSIFAFVQRGSTADAGATAVLIESDDVEELLNTGSISASLFDIAPGDLEDDRGARLIAVDASTRTAGLTIRQTDALDDEGEPTGRAPSIDGDLLFGSGDDVLELRAGSVTGSVAFGDGADQLILSGASISGSITDSDADLVIDVTNGRIVLSGSESLNLTDATFGEGGQLEIQISAVEREGAFVNASGAVTFASGSDLAIGLDGLIGQGGQFQVITADQLSVNDDAVLAATDAPFLYNATIERAQGDADTLVLSLTRKTADELGMNAAQAAAYNEALAAFEAVEALGATFAGLQTAESFFAGYNQLLPEYAASAIQFALANNDAATGALSARLRNARLAPDALAGVWAQEFGYFADRSGSAFGPGYRGQGIGLAIGLDRPVGPFYAVGLTLVGSASEIEEVDGFDEPMVALSGQFGAYAAADLGGVDVSGSLGLGFDRFETERRLLIGEFSSLTTAEWSGWHLAASATAGRDFTAGRWVIRPEASVTWLTLFESGYEETAEDEANAALALIVDDRESTSFSSAATVNIARRFGGQRSWWAPHMRVGYRGEFGDGGTETTAQFGETGSPFTLQSSAVPGSGYLLGVGLSAGSDYSTFTFAYDADVRDDFVRHVARLVIRLTF